MKSNSFKTGMMLAVIFFTTVINAQRVRKYRQGSPAKQSTKPVTDINRIIGLPIIIDSASVFDRIPEKSIKPPSTFPEHTGNRIPLPHENLRWDDALYTQKVWSELDLREKLNQTFRYDAVNDDGSTLFINILLKAVKSGEVQAFKDDRFSIPVTGSRLSQLISGELDTVPRYDPVTNIPDAFIVTRSGFDPKSVNKLLLMEEWIFDSKGGRMHSRIIGIAPLQARVVPGNKQTELSSILFWVSYNDFRPILANAEVYNPKNMRPNRMTWEELFESRMFSSSIVKSTIENPSNRFIKAAIKDPVFALLEGDNIKEKIFNYEQDLWSY